MSEYFEALFEILEQSGQNISLSLIAFILIMIYLLTNNPKRK